MSHRYRVNAGETSAPKFCARARWPRLTAGLLFGAALPAVFAIGVAHAGPAATVRVSVSSASDQGDQTSWYNDISTNGRFVAFESLATNLVEGDTNAMRDIFLRDRKKMQTALVSRDGAGILANGDSYSPAISSNGRFVAFSSEASNLVADDTNGLADIFVNDRVTRKTWLVSRSSAGIPGNGYSSYPSISTSGRYVAFESDASNLVDDDTNGLADVFLHDRVTKRTICVSRGIAGAQANGDSSLASISGSGRYVAFESDASNLAGDDSNAASDIFVYDRVTKKTARVSLGSDGAQADGRSSRSSISSNGRFVAFASAATNLAAGDGNGATDVFVHDRRTRETACVSVNGTGVPGDGASRTPRLSANGRYVAFSSAATDLFAGDANGRDDVFVRDRSKGKTRLVSISTSGVQGDGESHYPTIAANGRFVAFWSYATTLVADDTNGIVDVFVGGPLW